MQIKRLEDSVGRTLLLRGKGGHVELAPSGRALLDRARTLLAMNDETMAAFRAPPMEGTVRLGTPDDYALTHVPPILKRFAETHPAVQVDVVCSWSTDLVERIHAGELDLTLVSEGHEPSSIGTTPLWRGPLSWITSTRHAPHRISPLPLALAHRHGIWRESALSALDRARIPYRVAYTSATQIGTHAAVLAGLAVTVCALSAMPDGVRPMRPDEGLPPLPDFGILMMKSPTAAQPVTDALAEHIVGAYRQDAGLAAG
jgi:DNA-binding transcriptional LysR family regulator